MRATAHKDKTEPCGPCGANGGAKDSFAGEGWGMVKTPDRTDKTLVFRIIARRFPLPRVYRESPTEPTELHTVRDPSDGWRLGYVAKCMGATLPRFEWANGSPNA